MRAHELVASAIVLAILVLAAVQLNDQPLFSAGKVGEVRSDRKLARELTAAELTAFQLQPE